MKGQQPHGATNGAIGSGVWGRGIHSPLRLSKCTSLGNATSLGSGETISTAGDADGAIRDNSGDHGGDDGDSVDTVLTVALPLSAGVLGAPNGLATSADLDLAGVPVSNGLIEPK